MPHPRGGYSIRRMGNVSVLGRAVPERAPQNPPCSRRRCVPEVPYMDARSRADRRAGDGERLVTTHGALFRSWLAHRRPMPTQRERVAMVTRPCRLGYTVARPSLDRQHWMDQLLDSEDRVRQSNDGKADQRRENRDRGDPTRLLELTKLPVGHIRLSSSCSTTQPYDPSKQAPEDGCYAEEHKHGHHQQTRSPTGRVARLIIRFIIPRVRTEQGRRQRPCGVPPRLHQGA
jgi:hypothetical protein